MSAASDVVALYKNFPVYLWVEDEISRTYLEAAWGAQPTIGILIAGSGENLHPVVTSARRAGYRNVFGLRDRDFDESARSPWTLQGTVLRLDAHEIENFILDADALATSTLNASRRSAAEIRLRLHQEASSMVWGMALGATLRWLRRSTVAEFPSPGALTMVTDQTIAESRIFSTPWWTTTLPGIANTISQANVISRLSSEHQRFATMLTSNEWLMRFGGKEMLQRTHSYVAPSNEASREALARTVGRHQRETQTVPAEVSELLRLLLRVAA